MRMAALRVPGPSSGWFLAAKASMSRASSSGDLVDSVPRRDALLFRRRMLVLFGARQVDRMSNVGCARHPSKK